MSSETLKQYLSQTLRRVLRPLARIALRGELTHKEFVELTKLAFFDVARDDYGINGRKTNIARVAILTGMSRKECTRLKGLAELEEAAGAPMNPATRVISGWHEDPDYCTADGQPRELPFKGEAPSVSDLFKRYAGDIPDGALFSELQRIGAIESTDGEHWRVVKRSFIPDGFSREKIRILGNQLSDLGGTIVHNIEAEAAADRRMQRYVIAENLTEEDAALFQAFATEKGQALLEEFDAWLSQRAAPSSSDSPKTTQRAGLGMYFFQNDFDQGDQT